MPSAAVSTAQAIVRGSPAISRLGDTAKRNGTMYAAQPMRVAVQPVLSTSAPAMFAAAKADSATGGVTIDITPTQSRIRSTTVPPVDTIAFTMSFGGTRSPL